jgi:squalene-associated FAD-dependent desaturase
LIPRVAVVGAGWSGLACAVRLARKGCLPVVFDAAPAPGGRARRVLLNLGGRNLVLDNGQHLLIGAYTRCLALMRDVGLDPDALLWRRPFAVRYPDGFELAARRAPAPLHLALGLLAARGISWRARLSLVRWIDAQRRRGWRVAPDASAAELLHDQPEELTCRIWSPLCVAALNARPEHTSANMFLAILRDSVGADRSASDMLIPRVDLSALFPDAALRWITARGATVQFRTPVRGLAQNTPGGGWHVDAGAAAAGFDAVVLALAPDRAAALLDTVASPAGAALKPAIDLLSRIEAAPIATAWLDYGPRVRLDHALYALAEDPARGHFGQWVFDRGRLHSDLDGVLSVVISAQGPHETLDLQELARAVAGQLTAALRLPRPRAHRVLRERRATIVPQPGLVRPPARLAAPGLYLAGEAVDNAYPSTLEGSVRAGEAAADALCADFARRPSPG